MVDCQQDTVVKVLCYAGYRGEEAPRSFIFGEQELKVVEIVETWQLTSTEQPIRSSDPTG